MMVILVCSVADLFSLCKALDSSVPTRKKSLHIRSSDLEMFSLAESKPFHFICKSSGIPHPPSFRYLLFNEHDIAFLGPASPNSGFPITLAFQSPVRSIRWQTPRTKLVDWMLSDPLCLFPMYLASLVGNSFP